MPKRKEIISIIGDQYHSENIEDGEFSYKQTRAYENENHYKVDIRFHDDKSNVSVLVETKKRFRDSDKKQLFTYVELEKRLYVKHIVAILANTDDDLIRVWYDNEEKEDTKLKSMNEYIDAFKPKKINNKDSVLENTKSLNELLHSLGLDEKIRSQFVGTCLLALKKGFTYIGIDGQPLSPVQIIASIKYSLEEYLDKTMEKADKIAVINKNILTNKQVKDLSSIELASVIDFIKDNIYPYIDESSNLGQDILSIFFTTFNKYVGKDNKNQAFTPDYIVDFMCKIAEINKNSVVLDPTCGSGTFLVKAMVKPTFRSWFW